MKLLELLSRFRATKKVDPPRSLPLQNKEVAMDEFRKGSLHVTATPELITVESTSRCNLRCVMCPHAIGAVHRPKHLEEDLVGKLKSYLPRANAIQLHGIGEPLASPAFWKLLKLLPSPELCHSEINTNLTVLDEKRLKGLAESNLKVLNVSLDAATAETYRKIRGFDFNKVIKNIEKIVASKKARGSQYPIIYMNMTMMKSNIDEVVEFVRLASSLGANTVALWHLNRWPAEQMEQYKIKRDDWLFDYAEEGLWNFPELSNSTVRKAVAEAKRLGIELYMDHNKSIYFDEAMVEKGI